MSFNPLQHPAQLTGIHSIEASAGTGKTYSISVLWLRMIIEEGMSVDSILVSTFTTAATAELSERLLTALQKSKDICHFMVKHGNLQDTDDSGDNSSDDSSDNNADDSPEHAIIIEYLKKDNEKNNTNEDAQSLLQRLQQAISLFDLAPIKTIHGFCSSLIQRHILELGADPDIETTDSCAHIVDEIVGDQIMQHAEHAYLSVTDAKKISSDLAAEAHFSEQQVLLPAPEIPAHSHEDACAALKKFLEESEERLPSLKLGNSLNKTKRIIQQLAAGLVPEDALSKTADKKIAANWADFRAAITDVEKAIAYAVSQPLQHLVTAMRQSLPQRKELQGIYTFDDILTTVRDALIEQGADGALATAVRQRYQAVIIDECQDSDSVQIEVFTRLFCKIHEDPKRHTESHAKCHTETYAPTRCFIVIGDPKQSIYRFRGSDFSSYRQLTSLAQQCPEMTVNYRSDANLIGHLNNWYQQHPYFQTDNDTNTDDNSGDSDGEHKNEDGDGNGNRNGNDSNQKIEYTAVTAQATHQRIWDPALDDKNTKNESTQQGPQSCWALWSAHEKQPRAKSDLAEQVAQECQRLLQNGTQSVRIEDRHNRENPPRQLRASDIAILANGHAELRLIREALNAKNIPSQQAGQGLGNIYASDEALDILCWLQVLCAADSESGQQRGQILQLLLTFSASALGGLTAVGIQELALDPQQQGQWFTDLRTDLDTLRIQGPLPMLLHRLQHTQRSAHCLCIADGERRLTNWRHLGQLLQEEWGTGLRSSHLLQRFLARLYADANESAHTNSNLMKLETDLPAIQLCTIHSSKGLEYPIVFCPFLWHAKKPRDSKTAIIRNCDGGFIDVGSADLATNIHAAKQQEDNEKQRLLYVALTRARHRLYIGMAAEKSAHRSHIATLLGMTEDNKSNWAAENPNLILPPFSENPSSASKLQQGNIGEKTVKKTVENTEEGTEENTAQLSPPPQDIDTWKGALHRTASFSSLSSHAPHHGSAKDHDEESSVLSYPQAQLQAHIQAGLLEGLGGGTVLGNKIHNILEDVLGNGRSIEDSISEKSDEARDQMQRIISTIINTPMILQSDYDPASLKDLQNTSIAEMHFIMPLAHTVMSPQRLSQALLADSIIANNPEQCQWATDIAERQFKEFRGFMQGFIDLIFEFNGRWYIADYKTNQLTDYSQNNLDQEMIDADYLLQSRVYALALHRHLRRHLIDYNYDEHFGGCVYLFVRGFPDAGLWHDCPSLAGIEALDQLLAVEQEQVS